MYYLPPIKIQESVVLLRFKAVFCSQVLFKKGVPLLMPNRSGARGIHTAAAKGKNSTIFSYTVLK
jgi:hypothetical protein